VRGSRKALVSIALLMALPAAATGDGVPSWIRYVEAEGSSLDAIAGAGGALYVGGSVLRTSDVPGLYGLDALVSRCDVDGALLWTATYDSPADERLIAITADLTGVYVAIAFISETERWFQVDRFDPQGEFDWSIRVDDQPSDIDAGPDGFFLAGSALVGSGFRGYLKRFDRSGKELWALGFPVDRDEGYGSSIAVDADGVYVQTHRRALRKFGLDGTRVWEKSWRTSGVIDAFDGAVYIARPTPGSDGLIRKIDADGHVLWSRRFGTRRYEDIWGLYVDGSGVYVSGETSGAFPGQSYGGGQTDAFVRSYTHEGQVRGTFQFGTGAVEDALDVLQMEDGVFFVGTQSPRHRPQLGFVARIEGTCLCVPSRRVTPNTGRCRPPSERRCQVRAALR
jgi:hypothetical protein